MSDLPGLGTGSQDRGKKTTSKDGKRSADTDVSFNDLVKESYLLQSPSNFMADAQLAERLIKKEDDPGRLRGQLSLIGGDRARYASMSDRFAAGIENVGVKQGQLRSAAAQRAGLGNRGTNAASTLREALRTAKARRQMVLRGDEAIKNQQLKDRLMLVRQSQGRAALSVDLQGAGRQIKHGVDLSAQRAADDIMNARAGAVGAAAGATAGAFWGGDRDSSSNTKSSGRDDNDAIRDLLG